MSFFHLKIIIQNRGISRILFQNRPDLSSNEGSGIVQILVGLGLLGIITALFSNGVLNNLKAKKQIESSGNFGSVEQAFSNELAAILNSMSTTNCLSSSQIAFRNFGNGSGGGGIRYATNIGSSLSPAVAASVQSGMASGSESAKAKERCTHPLFIPSGSVADAAYNRMYFCLEFDKTTSGAEGAFTSSDHSFAEVAIYLKNSVTNSGASCNNFLTDRKTGAQVFYTLFWSNKAEGKTSYKKKNGVMFAKSPAPP